MSALRIAMLVAMVLCVASRGVAQEREASGEGEEREASGEGEEREASGESELANILESEDEARLEEWLTLHAHRGEEGRLIAGVLAVALGGIELPIESAILATSPQHPADATALVFGAVGVTFAVLDLAYGIYKLVCPSVQEERLARWRELRASGPLSERDLGRFEGEVRGELAGIEDGRRMWLAVGLGLVAAGALGTALTAALADSDLGIAVGYSVAGTAALSGILLAFIPWLDTGADAEWQRIEQGLGPQLSEIAPWVGPSGAGVTLSGTL